MGTIPPLQATDLRWCCDPAQLDFQTTDDLEDLLEFVGQERALEAVRFGIRMRREGYNLYVLGPPGMGKRTIIRAYLQKQSASEAPPDDWCYVNNFDDSQRPHALKLPAGGGARLVHDMDHLIEDLRTAIPAALEMEEHKSHIEALEEQAKQRHGKAFEALAEKAKSRGIQLIRTTGGFALSPIRDGEALSPEEFEKLPDEEKAGIQQTIAELQEELESLVEKIPTWRREIREKIKQLNREAAGFTIGLSLAELKKQYADSPHVLTYFAALHDYVMEHADDFQPSEEESGFLANLKPTRQDGFDMYRVNLIVDNGELKGAPVVYEEHPNYQNLMGRVEHESHMGTLVTNFRLIKPGALHRANGGFLVLDSIRLLQQPFAWEGLKRALNARHVKIESPAEALSLASTVSLEPEPIPLDVKVVLLGDRMLYYLLHHHDHDFAELFKVAADFDEEMDRSQENCLVYARLIATLVRRENHRPFDRTAVACVLEQSARVAADSEKLTTHMRTVADLIREADYWASQAEMDVVAAEHVQYAIEKKIHRSDRVRSRIQEEIHRGTLMIDTCGEQIGQINGLSVMALGNFSFGRPSRITATARLGRGEMVDIEREVELGGSLHSKGVLILSSFLASRFAANQPLSLAASLVFEQSYGMVDGDSASVAELCALLSVLADLPIKQAFAVTGSVNQHGCVQPIGGVNEKIEGFFDICHARGLSGDQAVLIPASNVKHLMLRPDVVAACDAGRFHVYPIDTVDQAITLLTGVPAGELDEAGKYPDGSVNQRVAARLLEMFELRLHYGRESRSDPSP